MLCRLTDREVRSFVSAGIEGRKLFDGGGLFLTIRDGRTVWRVRYTFAGRDRSITLGPWPSTTLATARDQAAEVRRIVHGGGDPVLDRRLKRASAAISSLNTFEALADQWLSHRRPEWTDEHLRRSTRMLKRHVIPELGGVPMTKITPPMVAHVIQTVVGSGRVESAKKLLQHCNCIFRYARALGLATDNPASDVSELLPKSVPPRRRPARLNIDGLRDLLDRFDALRPSPMVRLAHRLCAFSAARVGNVVGAEWSEFDLDMEQPIWRIPRAKLKARHRDYDHVVPLGPTIAREIREWREELRIWRDHMPVAARWVFPSERAKTGHISRELVERVYRTSLAISSEHSLHGWRSAFSTLARDAGFERDAVELALDHIHDSAVARAYDRGERLEQRRRLAVWWDEQLCGRRANTTA